MKALELLEKNSSIGVIQCKLLLMDARNKFDYAGDYLSQYGFLVQRASFAEEDSGQFDKPVNIFAAKSAGMIVRKTAFASIRGFDDDYFVYMEETDLCWRTWLNGWLVVFLPTSIVYHEFGKARKVKSARTRYLSSFHGTKNYVTTLIKNLDTINLLKILPIHIILWIAIVVRYYTKKRLFEANWIIKGLLYNLISFRSIWLKREFVQNFVRKVPDNDIFPHIMRKQPISYFFNKVAVSEKWMRSLEPSKS